MCSDRVYKTGQAHPVVVLCVGLGVVVILRNVAKGDRCLVKQVATTGLKQRM